MTADDYRKKLLAILSLDRMATEAASILVEPGDTEIVPRAEEVRELIVEMQANVETKLDRLAT